MDGVLFAVIGTVLLVGSDPISQVGSDPFSELHNDSNDTRLLVGPTARSLTRGEAYIDDVSIFLGAVTPGLGLAYPDSSGSGRSRSSAPRSV